MGRFAVFLASIATTFLLGLAPSNATVIDFNALSQGQSVTNQFAGLGVTFSTQTGTVVQNAAIGTYDPCCGTPTRVLTNSINGSTDRQQFLIIDFTADASNVSFLYDNYGGLFTGNNFKAYDSSDNLIEVHSPTLASADGLETITFSSTGISKLMLEQPGSDWIFAIDDLSFQVTAAVPEPSTWAMMILGFAGVGFMAYRQSRKDQGLALPAA